MFLHRKAVIRVQQDRGDGCNINLWEGIRVWNGVHDTRDHGSRWPARGFTTDRLSTRCTMQHALCKAKTKLAANLSDS